jgi:hypothetical protein
VLVDAPQWYVGRDGALPLILHSLAPGALIVVDDAGRNQEQWAIRRWLQTYAGLSLVCYQKEFGTYGVAVLAFNGDTTQRHSVRTWVSSAVHVGVNWAVRHSREISLPDWSGKSGRSSKSRELESALDRD